MEVSKIEKIEAGGFTSFLINTEVGEYCVTLRFSDTEYYVHGPRYISGGVCKSLEDCIAKVAAKISTEEAMVFVFED